MSGNLYFSSTLNHRTRAAGIALSITVDIPPFLPRNNLDFFPLKITSMIARTLAGLSPGDTDQISKGVHIFQGLGELRGSFLEAFFLDEKVALVLQQHDEP